MYPQVLALVKAAPLTENPVWLLASDMVKLLSIVAGSKTMTLSLVLPIRAERRNLIWKLLH